MLLLITLFFSFLITTPHATAATGFLIGSKTLEITDYSIVKNGIITGNYIQSDIFTVGGYQWAIEFYPQGWNSNFSDSVSIIIRLINPSNVAKAIYTLRLLDWNTSVWSTDTPANFDVMTFSSPGNTGWGYFSFMRRSNMEKSSYLRNDTLVIKTTIWVAKDSSTVFFPPLSTMVRHLYGWWQKFLPTADIPAHLRTENQACV